MRYIIQLAFGSDRQLSYRGVYLLLLTKGSLHILLPAVGRALRPTAICVSRRSYRGVSPTNILTDNTAMLKHYMMQRVVASDIITGDHIAHLLVLQ